MGVGIFAARKIALLNSINNLEFMMMQLSSRQMQLAQSSMEISMQQNNLQLSAVQPAAQQGQSPNAWGAAIQGAGAAGGFLGGDKYGQIGSILGAGAMSIAAIAFGGGGGGGATVDPNAALKQKQVELDNKLMQLKQQEKRLEMTMKQLETQLSMKNNELQAVEKGEEAAIKRSTPKYAD